MPPLKLRHKHPKPAADSEETKDASVEETKSINTTSVLRYDGSKNIAYDSLYLTHTKLTTLIYLHLLIACNRLYVVTFLQVFNVEF